MPKLGSEGCIEIAGGGGSCKSTSRRGNSLSERLLGCQGMAGESLWVWLEHGKWRKSVKGAWEEGESKVKSAVRLGSSREAS